MRSRATREAACGQVGLQDRCKGKAGAPELFSSFLLHSFLQLPSNSILWVLHKLLTYFLTKENVQSFVANDVTMELCV